MSLLSIRSCARLGCSALALVAACRGVAPAAPALAALGEPPAYTACRASRAPLIDGRLETDWGAADWTADFQDITGNGAPPRWRTRAKLQWDDTALYIASALEDSDVWAQERERDAPLHLGNALELFLDPGADARDYIELQINALGTIADLFLVQPYRAGGPARSGWDLRGLRAAIDVQGSLNRPGDRDQGWTVELALPWVALAEATPARRAPRAEEIWRVNLARVHWPHEVDAAGYRTAHDASSGRPAPEQYWVWSPQGAVDLHRPERWGFVRFASTACSAAADQRDSGGE